MKIILALSALLVVTCASSDSCSEDMIQATKYNKMAENTLRKANRIETWLAMVTKRKQKAANSTMFSYGHAGLKFAVENGTNCAGGKYGGSALATLSSCKSSASEKCDSSSMDTNSLSPCMKDAEAIVNAHLQGEHRGHGVRGQDGRGQLQQRPGGRLLFQLLQGSEDRRCGDDILLRSD